MSKTLVILGSTGSIGEQALDVARKNGYCVKAIAASKSIDKLEKQAREFSVEAVAVFDETCAKELAERLADTDTKVLSGVDGVCEVASLKADIVLNAIVGIAGLKPMFAAMNAKNDVALANKETLVTAGELVNAKAKEMGIKIIPVDSEHSAIFQSLQGAPKGSLKKVILTASGGPFYGKTYDELENVTVAEALNHPNWSMGSKITIDSATLMNKGLEVIEAVHLFGISANDIEVLVHRQSILHSAVELCDGAVIGQMGTPDMRLPIEYAITYPERGDICCDRLSLSEVGTLTFAKPDTKTFKCLKLCIDAINAGGLKPAAANGANEEAVALFLAGKIKFLDIPRLVEMAISAQPDVKEYDLEDVFVADKNARELVRNQVG
ncbi:MAG: 1-deoxy-D-xylulose-5-phosphate reductoisomerase [Ruminococcaceae bacterium]|nr:1-deoxy-D-xylulose-5-phosphate reductoisomerase [Oscillospiraceae bacterium]